MAKPTEKPEVASSDVDLPLTGQPNKVKPTGALLTVGYDRTVKPACEEWNWLWNNTKDWIDYFEGLHEAALQSSKIASQGDVDTGTNNDLAVTPLTLANTGSLSKNTANKVASGWFKDEKTGLITQWGESTSDTVALRSFPIAFPSTILAVMVTRTGVSVGYSGNVQEDASVRSTTQFRVAGFSSGGVSTPDVPYTFLAIGY